MESVHSVELDKLAKLLFEKTGLSRCVRSINDEIEAHSWSEIAEEQVSKILTMYSLQL